MKNTPVLVSLLLFVALNNLSQAESLRCGETGAVVSSGDTTAEVLAKCGAPTQRQKRQECGESHEGRRRADGQKSSQGSDCTIVDTWTYNFGPRRLVHKLIFKSGRLTAIQTPGYGK